MSKHYWRNRFGRTYIWLGLGAFVFLPTHTLPEAIIRIIFILLGVGFLISSIWDNRRLGSILLVTSLAVLVLWMFVGTGLLIIQYNQLNRIHFFYMALWFFFAEEHYRAIQGLRDGE